MKAIIPVAGLGTRMYPMTHVIPKPFMPLIDPNDGRLKPAIHLIVDEAARSGIEKICIVLHPSQKHFFHNYFFAESFHPSFPRQQIQEIKALSQLITFEEQTEPNGFGHAVYCGRKFTKNSYFVVLLGDHVYHHYSPLHSCVSSLLNAFKSTNRSLTSVDMHEKPSRDFAKLNLTSNNSNLKLGDRRYFCNFGIDILSPEIFDILEKSIVERKDNSEIQLRDAMKKLWKTKGLDALFMNGERYDFGVPSEYRRTISIFSREAQLSYSISHLPESVKEEVYNFIERLSRDFKTFFEGFENDIHISRSPGRLDVMGGIGDYSGCTVLQLPIQESTLVGLQVNNSRNAIKVYRRCGDENSVSAILDCIDKFQNMSYGQINNYFKLHFGSSPWMALLSKEVDARILQSSMNIIIESTVPESKGVSSSAAIEVAIAHAVVSAFKLQLSSEKIAILCQKAENLIVGAACGIMDQVACTFGKEGHLTSLVCQPLKDIQNVTIPEDVALWGINSGVSRSVAGSAYTNTRVGAFMGYRIIAQLAGLKAESIGDSVVVADSHWHGYLANISPSEFEQFYLPKLPHSVTGKEFVSKYSGSTDRVTKIVPDITYDVINATKHPIYENERIQKFIQGIKELGSKQTLEKRLADLGQLMYESHESYSACGMGSYHTNLLVELVKQKGASHGYGARITGGGGGGTVVVLGVNSPEALVALKDIQAQYFKVTGLFPELLSGSSMGAADFGSVIVSKQM